MRVAKARFTKRRMAGARAEVLGEVQDGVARPRRRLRGNAAEERDLRPAEAVDRLLGVAHHDQAPGRPPVSSSATSTCSGSVSWNSSMITHAEALAEVAAHGLAARAARRAP